MADEELDGARVLVPTLSPQRPGTHMSFLNSSPRKEKEAKSDFLSGCLIPAVREASLRILETSAQNNTAESSLYRLMEEFG